MLPLEGFGETRAISGAFRMSTGASFISRPIFTCKNKGNMQMKEICDIRPSLSPGPHSPAITKEICKLRRYVISSLPISPGSYSPVKTKEICKLRRYVISSYPISPGPYSPGKTKEICKLGRYVKLSHLHLQALIHQ